MNPTQWTPKLHDYVRVIGADRLSSPVGYITGMTRVGRNLPSYRVVPAGRDSETARVLGDPARPVWAARHWMHRVLRDGRDVVSESRAHISLGIMHAMSDAEWIAYTHPDNVSWWGQAPWGSRYSAAMEAAHRQRDAAVLRRPDPVATPRAYDAWEAANPPGPSPHIGEAYSEDWNRPINALGAGPSDGDAIW